MAARKVLTRAESQAQTRQDVLDAAQELFYANGYHATSIAAIAAEAGRTIGAVYSNFESKEALCLEVLKARYLTEFTRFVGKVVESDGSIEGRLGAMTAWVSDLSDETRLVILTSEYLTGTFDDGSQTAANHEFIGKIKDSVRTIIEDALPDEVSPSDSLMDDAITTALSTAIGLGIAKVAGIVDRNHAVELMAETFRLWLSRFYQTA